MLNRDEKSDSAPFIRNILLDMCRMKSELNEHRYYLERKVSKRTEQLLKRIALLESCNAALGDRLAAAQKKLLMFMQQPESPLPQKDSVPDGTDLKLCVAPLHEKQPGEAGAPNHPDRHTHTN
ncbi:MAG: hypothetical protein IPM27_08355 [Nitrosomonadales bacterium]|nr:hypothetical protein [Nitrosomonadales bacterium]